MRAESKVARRRAAVGLAALILSVFVLLTVADAAAAHRGSAPAAGHSVRSSNMVGQCGNGWDSYCYSEHNRTWAYSASDAHTWRMWGYWQERRIGRGRYSCQAVLVAGPHGRGWVPSTERCYKL